MPQPTARIIANADSHKHSLSKPMPAASAIREFDRDSVHYDVCERASLILEHAHKSAQSILKAFSLVRSQRATPAGTGTVGMTTDEEQDLLRAILVMSAAGVDTMAKQVVRDALPFVVHDNDLARAGLEAFIERRLKSDFESLQEGRRAKFVPAMLASHDLKERTTSEYISHLTAGSLQSADELRRIAAAFGLTEENISVDFLKLREIFDVRNKIIHELDINLSAQRRNRNIRRKNAMVRDTNTLLEAGEDILIAIDKQVDRSTPIETCVDSWKGATVSFDADAMN